MVLIDRFEHHVDLPNPPSEVWAFVTDLARTPEWRTTITSIEPPVELSVGSEFSGTTRLLGRTWHWVLRITEVEFERRFAYEVVRGVAKPTVEYAIEPTVTGCRFTMAGSIGRMGVVARALRPFAVRALRRETARHLDNLRRILEAPAGTGTDD